MSIPFSNNNIDHAINHSANKVLSNSFLVSLSFIVFWVFIVIFFNAVDNKILGFGVVNLRLLFRLKCQNAAAVDELSNHSGYMQITRHLIKTSETFKIVAHASYRVSARASTHTLSISA